MGLDFSNVDTYLNVFGVAGTLATLIGLYIAIREATRAKQAARKAETQAAQAETAAEAAEKAVQGLRDTLRQTNAIADLTTAMSGLEEIKRLQRLQAWSVLPDRYSVLRRTLITISTANPRFPDTDRATLLGAANQLGIMEASVDRMLKGGRPVDWTKLNTTTSKQMDKLEQVLTALREQIGV